MESAENSWTQYVDVRLKGQRGVYLFWLIKNEHLESVYGEIIDSHEIFINHECENYRICQISFLTN